MTYDVVVVGGGEGVDAEAAKAEVATYNRAVQADVAFNPNVKDGRSTVGLTVNKSNWAIPGLYAAGELVGGIFYFNYPGGTGLTCGSVFGKIAGASAGQFARSNSAGVAINS